LGERDLEGLARRLLVAEASDLEREDARERDGQSEGARPVGFDRTPIVPLGVDEHDPRTRHALLRPGVQDTACDALRVQGGREREAQDDREGQMAAGGDHGSPRSRVGGEWYGGVNRSGRTMVQYCPPQNDTQ